MNVIKKIAIVAIPFLLLLFFPKGACATERYQQQNYWYKADSNQNADVALNNPRKVNAAYVDDGNVSIGRLITAGNAISRRSEIKNYLVGKDIYEKEWYFCGEDTNAKWVHPVDYNTESIEYPDTLFCEEKCLLKLIIMK